MSTMLEKTHSLNSPIWKLVYEQLSLEAMLDVDSVLKLIGLKLNWSSKDTKRNISFLEKFKGLALATGNQSRLLLVRYIRYL